MAAVQNNISGTVRFLDLCSWISGPEKKLQTLVKKSSSFNRYFLVGTFCKGFLYGLPQTNFGRIQKVELT